MIDSKKSVLISMGINPETNLPLAPSPTQEERKEKMKEDFKRKRTIANQFINEFGLRGKEMQWVWEQVERMRNNLVVNPKYY